MTRITLSLNGRTLLLDAAPLTPTSFSPFGDVIQNPLPTLHPSAAPSHSSPLPLSAIIANQGTAIKYQHPSHLLDLYSSAPSHVPSKAVMNMFVCAARKLLPDVDGGKKSAGLFPVQVLERHPFTTQTFIPLSSTPSTIPSRYLVIVAPSLPPSAMDADLPVPEGEKLPGRGLPAVKDIRAFIATSEQAVTYGAGTWHAPMVALGREGQKIDFVVVQFANGVAGEDCQEVFLEEGEGKGGVVVRVEGVEEVRGEKGERAKL